MPLAARPWKRPLAAAVTAMSLAAIAPPAAAAGGHIDWHPCPQDTTADCGTLTLPIDWARPQGASFGLAVARRKATDPSARIGSLVTDWGGPGISGVDAVVGRYKDVFSPAVRTRFDLVSFDPRGFGRSGPVTCDMAAAGPQPTTDPATRRGYADLVAYNRRLAMTCRDRTGPIYDHIDSRATARDIDALRAALGDRKLTYWGVSYGSLIGQQYAELFPGRIRALALDSNLDHSRRARGYLDAMTSASEDSFDQFAAWCATSTDCVLHGRDVAAVFEQLYARAQAGTLPDPDDPTSGITPQYLLEHTQHQFAMMGSDDWASLATMLAAMSRQPSRSVPPKPVPPSGQGLGYDQKVFCADWQLSLDGPRALANTQRRLARIAPHMRRATLAWSVMASCQGDPVPLTNPPHRYRISGTPPILLVNNLHDPSTPYAFATDIARQIPAAVLLTYDGRGHGSYNRSRCIADLTDHYLIDTRPPARGTHCPATP
ncbi:alpha/beta hydrolase [Actinomadura harenae]|uniref:Alpha/beta hydrolase n=1 Tax=Actinomadura harenae TaxID=2483351 RepID=A0A3M2LI53_9ACTN|nr:alpha/beta hydrolase [Actinomadura harenae]RMI36223.1 alpha/beta hydrolase [Actinomadura harenae]